MIDYNSTPPCKAMWRREKNNALTALNIGRLSGRLTGVGFEHLAPMLHCAWKHGFTEERNLYGWKKEGIIPFTRSEYWVLKNQVESQQLLSSKASGVYARTPQRDAQGSPESASEGNAAPDNQGSWAVPKDVMQAAEQAIHSTNNGLDANIAARLLQKLGSFILQKGGSEDVRELLSMPRVADTMQRMHNADPRATKVRGVRVTAKDVWSLAGSATGDEAMDMARRRASEKQRKDTEVEQRREERIAKRRRILTDAVMRAEAVMQEIARQGPARLKSLVVKDLQALLLHDRPDGTADTKGSKAELLPRVATIPDVVRALEQFSSSQNNAPSAPPRQDVELLTVYPPMPLPQQPPPQPPASPQAPYASALRCVASQAPSLHGGSPPF